MITRQERAIFVKISKMNVFFLGDPVCNVVKLTKTVFYMGKMRKKVVFYWTLHILYGGNENFIQLMHIHITIENKLYKFGC